MLAKKTSKNQITLPKEIVKAFPDAKYFDVSIRDNTIRLSGPGVRSCNHTFHI